MTNVDDLVSIQMPIRCINIQSICIIDSVCSKSIVLSYLLTVVGVLVEIKTTKDLSHPCWVSIDCIFYYKVVAQLSREGYIWTKFIVDSLKIDSFSYFAGFA